MGRIGLDLRHVSTILRESLVLKCELERSLTEGRRITVTILPEPLPSLHRFLSEQGVSLLHISCLYVVVSLSLVSGTGICFGG